MRKVVLSALLVLLVVTPAGAAVPLVPRTLDGGGNNVANPTWGQTNTQYIRVAAPNYDGPAKPVKGPPTRFVSNRIFNDVGQNLFSENRISQWGWTWGQFMDHTFGLRDERELAVEHAPIAFDASDPLEGFRNDFGAIDFFRTPAAPGTGFGAVPRQHINTVSSYIDGFSVYGGTNARLDWLREGSLDGNPANNGARMLLPNDYLPRVTARGNRANAPQMDLMGALVGTPDKAAVAGDVRANENIALTAAHTLFAREHNRIVAQLNSNPAAALLSQEDKFQIARKVVGAEQQLITYNEFLPALGVRLAPYQGYNPNVNASLGNEFAVVGYRAHSMIHGEFEPTVPVGTYTDGQLDTFEEQGIEVEENGDGTITLVIPLVVAFGNPDLVEQVGLGTLLESLGEEGQYKNDEQIDNALRSVLFQVPKPGIPDPTVCGSPVIDPDCFTGVVDLGAIDVERGRDHGMPFYNDLRRAYGLAPKASFTAITGESTEQLPAGTTINDPRILEFTEIRDANGNVIPVGSEEGGVVGVRRSTLAARLKAVYGNLNKVDAFTGMVSERHVPGTEFGELQLAIWKKQFEALRDGDRFFFQIDPDLVLIQTLFGITYRHTLAELIKLNTGVTVQANVFKATG